jgi:murein DD-endopeptidase MepM/ murein hydrolase activator NlpD
MRLLALAGLGLIAAGLHAQAARSQAVEVRVSIVSRAIAPGEVLRLDINATGLPSTVTVNGFDKAWPAASLGDGRFLALVGIDLDVPPGPQTLTVSARAGETVAAHDERVVVDEKSFPTRQLTVAPRFVNPPASAQPRIDRERRRLGALFRSVTPSPRWRGAFRRPIESTVVSGFGVRSVYNGEPRAPHGGADFSSPTGTPVAAPGGGRVVLAGSLYYTGDSVVVDHGLGLVSLFAHLSRIDVKVGDEVQAGDPIGRVGATGRVTGPHLHWTVRLNGARVDPLSVIAVLDSP